jgi:hypothetical protein
MMTAYNMNSIGAEVLTAVAWDECIFLHLHVGMYVKRHLNVGMYDKRRVSSNLNDSVSPKRR